MRVRRRTLLAVLVAVLVAVPVLAAESRRYIDPSYPYATCEPCHGDEGYLPVELVPVVPPEVESGQTFNVSAVVVNPWKHEIRGIDVGLNLSRADGRLAFAAAGSDDTFDFEGRMPCCEGRVRQVQVRPGLERFVVGFEGAGGALDGNEWRVTVHGATRKIGSCTVPAGAPAGGYDGTCTVDVQGADLPADPSGTWEVEVRLEDSRNATGTHGWQVTGRAAYDTATVRYKSIPDVKPFGQGRATWRVRAVEQGTYAAIFDLRSELFHEHKRCGDCNSAFIDHRAAREALVGDEYVPAETDVGGASVRADPTAFLRSWGKVTGFASLMMILPSFLFVGVFSKQNKFAMNRFFGSARNRIVWHAAVSWIIILLAVVHALMFLLEPRFDVLDFDGYKFVTGWAALAFMGVLGVSGLWQIPFTKKMGYKWWRRLHMVAGIAAFALSVFHTVWDGEDFAWLAPQATRTAGMVASWVGVPA